MEIRDPIHGALEINLHEAAVIDSAAFQRLRSIKQLGFSEFSYPGATHNRYIHSLGVSHLSSEAFDSIFKGFHFDSQETRWRLRQVVRLAALLHDIGHGPLSHTTEEVMPVDSSGRRLDHEDYTISFILNSSLTEILKSEFKDFSPKHIACLIDSSMEDEDRFFWIKKNGGESVNLRPILSQIVSSELDVDRMDYLLRDSYFCGTDYGKIEVKWLISNLTHYQVNDELFLALSRRALYTFDDFLISRHHMYLMVYFHHKSIIYDEMLHRYLNSPDCKYKIPADVNEYIRYTDSHLYEHLKSSQNTWARRISERRPYRVLFELHETEESATPRNLIKALSDANIDSIHSSSIARLSKYHQSLVQGHGLRIFVVDPYNKRERSYPLEEATQIFQMYERSRRVERVYVSPEDFHRGEDILSDIQR
jgi:HD superfamily phosphohydrolase